MALYVAGMSTWAASVQAPPDAVLPDLPLYAASLPVKPNMVLDLSVTSSTTGAAYRTPFDIKAAYVGYWDPMGCYDYSTADGYFKRTATASISNGAIACSDQWSGNLLNWAASSAVDMLRYALTGGDRVKDTPSATVLQRAVLPSDFYNSSHFSQRSVEGHLDKLTPLVAKGGVEKDGTLHFSNCSNLLFVGPTSSGTCSNPGTDQSFGPDGSGPYLARVEVCSTSEGPVRSGLCVRYPNGEFKPAGTIQAFAEKMRFAAFGYLMEQGNARYGGALRAPMKFVGPTTESDKFEKLANAEAEWDADSGVFLANPLSSSEGTSGVVNYINQYGRTGSAIANYKDLDPAGEMYYESLRYLQGLEPTTAATRNITAAMGDGFPVYNGTSRWGAGAKSGWDPVVSSCQRNHVVVIGSPYTDHDGSLPGLMTDGLDGWAGLRQVEAADPDTAFWSRIVGAFENNEALSYPGPSGSNATLMTRGNDAGPRAIAYTDHLANRQTITSANIDTLDVGADQGSLGWAGLAYWANTQSIRGDYPGVRVKTYAVDMDESGSGTMGEKQRGSSFYLAAKYGGFDDKNNDGNPFVTSIGAGADESFSNAEWQSGVDNDAKPKPAKYFLADEPRKMVAAVRRIFASASAGASSVSSGSPAGGALSNSRIASTGGTLYVPQADSTRWSGSVLAYKLRHENGAAGQDATPIWNAGDRLTGNLQANPPIQARDPDTRRIFTMLSSGAGAEFTWNALKEDATLKGRLDTEPYSATGTKDNLGEARVDYLRGDRSKEAEGGNGQFRTRDSVMGDIANAAPLWVENAAAQAVYVGSNDGMLHAFAADSGDELFAYVPRALHARLGAYTSPDYGHQSYVDGNSVSGEIQSANGSAKTVLVSGMGGGARGVFALDISDPARFSEDRVMWEFTGADDSDMGHVTQAPRIMKFRTEAAAAGQAGVYRWFAVVPSGFNNGNPNKAAALFLLALDKQANTPWVIEKDYFKIVLPDPVDATVVNALGPVGDYTSADNTTLLLFAGDTQGNLWKFDFTKSAPWNESAKSGALALSGAPLMVAKDDAGKRQPITIAPEVGAGPNGGAIVLFGTGKFVEIDDLTSRNTQTLYSVYDTGMAISDSETRTHLQQRQVKADIEHAGQFTISGDAFVYGNYNAKTPHRRGWYFDLPDAESQGERQVSQMVLSDGYLVFNTLIPDSNVCGLEGNGGGGHSCAVNAMTGLSSGSTCIPSTVGVLGAPLLIQEGEGAFSSTDTFGRRIERKKVSVINLGSGEGSRPGSAIVSPIAGDAGGVISQIAGRLNWREVLNFKDIRK